jgi:ankyrin repeat protein
MAVQRRDVPMVRLLLSKGADPKRSDNVAGYSALDYAKQDKRATAVLKLLEAPPAKPERPVAGPKL